MASSRLAPSLLALALALALAGCAGGDGDGLTREQGPGLVLERADLPAVFEQFDGGKQGRVDQVFPRDDPARFDRVDGWKARFRRSGSQRTRGPLVVESLADLFRDSDGAEDDLAAYRDSLERGGGGVGAGARVLEDPEVGDESLAIATVQTGPPPVRFFTVAWRHDNATASVTVNGFQVTLADAVSLARKQERRMTKAAAAG